MTGLSNAGDRWRWERRRGQWWRVCDALAIEDGPHERVDQPAPRLVPGLEWWYVSLPEPGATFAVGVSRSGRVVAGPPYMRRQIGLGRTWAGLAAAFRRGAARRGPVIIKALP